MEVVATILRLRPPPNQSLASKADTYRNGWHKCLYLSHIARLLLWDW
jgi:hypothetical protein